MNLTVKKKWYGNLYLWIYFIRKLIIKNKNYFVLNDLLLILNKKISMNNNGAHNWLFW
jgi:hypothetical protein